MFARSPCEDTAIRCSSASPGENLGETQPVDTLMLKFSGKNCEGKKILSKPPSLWFRHASPKKLAPSLWCKNVTCHQKPWVVRYIRVTREGGDASSRVCWGTLLHLSVRLPAFPAFYFSGYCLVSALLFNLTLFLLPSLKLSCHELYDANNTTYHSRILTNYIFPVSHRGKERSREVT